MKSIVFIVSTIVALSTLSSTVFASPVVPGLSQKHPLSEAQAGQLLITELRCASCHPGTLAPPIPGPDLTDVGARVSPDYLRKMIASPAKAHPGTTMPEMLSSEPADRREQIATAITHFLISRTARRFERSPVNVSQMGQGKELFHSVGCVVCHADRTDDSKENAREGVIALSHVSAKYSTSSLADFLVEPSRARPAGRMPDMKLTAVEASAISQYLVGKSSPPDTNFQLDDRKVVEGKEHFKRLQCASCHSLPDLPAVAPTAPRIANLNAGCMADSPGKSPHYGLDKVQAQAIRVALSKKLEPLADKDRLAITLTTFNCIACHTRDDYGGVSEEMNPHFRSVEKELGDEGRIPPPLTLVGAKLQKVTLAKVLHDGDTVRHYMSTRMPQYGEKNLRHLPELFARLDSVKNVEFRLPKAEGGGQQERDREKEMRAAGRELVGEKGLSCVACHTFNGRSAGKPGIDLLTSTQRLQPSWFFHFVRDPARFRPRTVMPTAWPGGEALHRKILDGDTDRQIEAIWYYLSLGTSAPEPIGVRPVETLLTVTDQARTYRGRSSVAGFRGIAVGLPEKWNYAFNAETGTLSAIWKGDFVRVNRSGQGSGGFNPPGKFVQLAQDVSFCELADEKTPWPSRPVMTKESPINPDPLYPKNRGYQFAGYLLDDSAVPTLQYRSGDIRIDDRSVVKVHGSTSQLVRTLTFDSSAPRTVWFRALVGKVESESKTQYKVPGLRMTVPDVKALLRPVSTGDTAAELLLRFDVPRGKSTQELRYELLP